jgi:hypothetical protein
MSKPEKERMKERSQENKKRSSTGIFLSKGPTL